MLAVAALASGSLVNSWVNCALLPASSRLEKYMDIIQVSAGLWYKCGRHMETVLTD